MMERRGGLPRMTEPQATPAVPDLEPEEMCAPAN
jgi:hypothetical protein